MVNVKNNLINNAKLFVILNIIMNKMTRTNGLKLKDIPKPRFSRLKL